MHRQPRRERPCSSLRLEGAEPELLLVTRQIAFAQLFFSFGCRSFRYTLPQLGLFSNPWLLGAIALSTVLQIGAVTLPFLAPLFKVDAAGFTWEWAMIAALALAPVSIIEVTKLLPAIRSQG